jgi:hypothetical protein
MAAFDRDIGIDYSGAATPTSILKALRIYLAEGDAPPVEILPPPLPRKYWTRRGIAEWLVERLGEDVPTLIGIDHGFSFPLRYSKAHGRWRRLTEERAGSAKSVFQFDVQGSVAKSTRAGVPGLRFIRQQLGERVHFWPFDGWDIPAGRSAVVEVYPSLWSGNFAREERNGDQHDAYSAAAWMRRADLDGSLAAFLNPSLATTERAVAKVEGWILGVA